MKKEEGVITGKVVSIDDTLSTIILNANDGKQTTFYIVSGETILWKGIEDIQLCNIGVGETVEIGYHSDDSGKLISDWVDIFY